jgi:hypothetical protein
MVTLYTASLNFSTCNVGSQSVLMGSLPSSANADWFGCGALAVYVACRFAGLNPVELSCCDGRVAVSAAAGRDVNPHVNLARVKRSRCAGHCHIDRSVLAVHPDCSYHCRLSSNTITRGTNVKMIIVIWA